MTKLFRFAFSAYYAVKAVTAATADGKRYKTVTTAVNKMIKAMYRTVKTGFGTTCRLFSSIIVRTQIKPVRMAVAAIFMYSAL